MVGMALGLLLGGLFLDHPRWDSVAQMLAAVLSREFVRKLGANAACASALAGLGVALLMMATNRVDSPVFLPLLDLAVIGFAMAAISPAVTSSASLQYRKGKAGRLPQ